MPTLILSLSDEALVDVAIDALTRTGAPAVVPLMNLITSKDQALQEPAEKALHAMAPQVALDLAPLVGDRKSMERFVAARALGEMGNAEAITVLVNCSRVDRYPAAAARADRPGSHWHERYPRADRGARLGQPAAAALRRSMPWGGSPTPCPPAL